MVDPSMRFLVLKARRKETGTITEGHAQLSDGKNKVNNPAEVSARPKKNNNDASHALWPEKNPGMARTVLEEAKKKQSYIRAEMLVTHPSGSYKMWGQKCQDRRKGLSSVLEKKPRREQELKALALKACRTKKKEQDDNQGSRKPSRKKTTTRVEWKGQGQMSESVTSQIRFFACFLPSHLRPWCIRP